MKDSVDIRAEFVSYSIADVKAVSKLFAAESENKTGCTLTKIKTDIPIARSSVIIDEDNCKVILSNITEYMLSRRETIAYFTAIKSRILDTLPTTHIYQQGRLRVTAHRTDSIDTDGTITFKTQGVEKPI